jgi:hypothetical protein
MPRLESTVREIAERLAIEILRAPARTLDERNLA